MNGNESGIYFSMNGLRRRVGPDRKEDWAMLESLVREDYERAHPDDRFDDLKRRARFSKEDQGLLQQWLRLARQRAEEHAPASGQRAGMPAASRSGQHG